MDIVLVMSLFWTAYGILGVLGFQVIPGKYQGQSWTKSYIRRLGISWLLLGIPWLVCNRAVACLHADIGTGPLCLLLLILAVPSLLFTWRLEKKYRPLAR